MLSRLLSLLALLALALMPLAMSAPAAAAPVAATGMAPGEHCPPEQPGLAGKAVPGGHCVAGCALLLPQLPQPGMARPALAGGVPAGIVSSLMGLTPAIGTPPPKIS